MYRTLFFLTITILFQSCKKDGVNSKSRNYTININATNFPEGSNITLKKQENNVAIVIDSTALHNGKASFNGKIDLPQVYGIFINDEKEGIFPIIEKGIINIQVNSKDLNDAIINGTELNDQLNLYKDGSKKISSKMNDLFHEFQKARAENNPTELNEINKQMKAIQTENNQYSLDFVRNNPRSFVASMVLYSLLENNNIHRDTIATLFSKLSDDVKKSEFSNNIAISLEVKKITKDSLP